MKTAACRALGALLALAPWPALGATPFDDGLAARKEWEAMITSSHDDERRGAEYWAGQRSRTAPGACEDGSPDLAFIMGCRSAQTMLGPSDARRRSEPEFRRGWNSYQALPQPRFDCAAIAGGTERLACYDAANRGSPLVAPGADHAPPVPKPPPAQAPSPSAGAASAGSARPGSKPDFIPASVGDDEHMAEVAGMSLPDYKTSRDQALHAYSVCKDEVESRATWGYTSDWFPKYSWLKEGSKITVVAKDIRLKNAFNAERYVVYSCRYDIITKSNEVLLVE